MVGGDRVADTPYRLPFRQDVEAQELCTLTLNASDLDLLRKAVQNDYFIKVCVVAVPGPRSEVLAWLLPWRAHACYWRQELRPTAVPYSRYLAIVSLARVLEQCSAGTLLTQCVYDLPCPSHTPTAMLLRPLRTTKPPSTKPTSSTCFDRAQWFVDDGLPVWAFVGTTMKHIIGQPPQQQGQQGSPNVHEGANGKQQPQQAHARGGDSGGVSPSSSPGRRVLQTTETADTDNEHNRDYGSVTSRASAHSSSGYYHTASDNEYGSGYAYTAAVAGQPDFIADASPESTRRWGTTYILFTHVVLQLSYNNGFHVVEASVTSDPMRTVDITSAQQLNVTFTYGVQWQHRPGTAYMQRMDRYVRSASSVMYLEVGPGLSNVTWWERAGDP